MKLYHATFQSYLSAIKKRGLLPGQRKNWEDCFSGYVYFSNDPDVAISFCEAAEDTPADVYGSGICCFEIDLKDLNPELLTDDPNILEQEDDTPSGCYAYAGGVSYNKLHLYRCETLPVFYLTCEYISSWDGFGEVSSPAKYDPINNKVYDVEPADLSDDDLAECKILVGEYMDLSGTRFVLGERSFDDTWTVKDPNPLCVISSMPDLRSKASLASKIQSASARVIEPKPIVHISKKNREFS